MDKVTACAALVVPTPCDAKVRVLALSTPVPPCPVPLSAMLCGLPVALLVTVTLPVRAPLAVGLKVTLMVQNPPAPSPVPQLWVTPNSELAAMLAKVSAAVPELVSVTLCAALVLPIFCSAKVNALGKPETNAVSWKLAETLLAASMVKVQVGAAPALAHAPPQATKLAAGLAVRVTSKPRPALPLQVLPQLMAPPLTVPAPVLLTLRGTVSKESKEANDCPERTRRT